MEAFWAPFNDPQVGTLAELALGIGIVGAAVLVVIGGGLAVQGPPPMVVGCIIVVLSGLATVGGLGTFLVMLIVAALGGG